MKTQFKRGKIIIGCFLTYVEEKDVNIGTFYDVQARPNRTMNLQLFLYQKKC